MKGTTLNFSENCLDGGGHYISSISTHLNIQLNTGSSFWQEGVFFAVHPFKYWLSGLVLSVLPVQTFLWKENSHFETSCEGLCEKNKREKIAYAVISAVLFCIFYFYPSYAQLPYGWIFNRLAFKDLILGNFFQ